MPRALVDRRRARRAERAQRLPHVAAHDRLLNLLEELRDVRRRGVGGSAATGGGGDASCGGVARLVHSGTGVDEPGLRAEMATLPTSGVSGRRFDRDGGRGGVGGAVASWSGARWRRSPCGEPAAARRASSVCSFMGDDERTLAALAASSVCALAFMREPRSICAQIEIASAANFGRRKGATLA